MQALTSNKSHHSAAANHVAGPAGGHATIDLGDAGKRVTLQGGNNAVTGGSGNDTVTGGLSNNTITLGNGNDTVKLSAHAEADHVVLGAGNDTITASPGAWGNSFTFEGSTASLILQGNDNTVFVNGGSDSIVNGYADPNSTVHGSLLLEIGNLGGNVDVTGFPVAGGTVCLAKDLGFASGSAAAAALKCDGHGGSMLTLGGCHGSLDFANIAPAMMSTAHFTVC